MNTPLYYLTATQILHLFKTKQLSPVELMKAMIERAGVAEPKINSFSATYFDEALEKAKRAESNYIHGKATGFLEGLPVAIKAEADVKGQVTSCCSLAWKDNVATKNAVFVERLLNEGAIIHARTATPEFSALASTHSRLNGVSRNPWNLDMTCGGSSGGSGSALSAGTTVLASGSDMGGSIRIPASYCGVVGYKPPYGRVPEDAYPFNLDPFNAEGVMARTVVDAALMENIICGPHPMDIATLKPKYELPLEFDTNMQGFKIAYSKNLGYVDVDTDIIKAMEETMAIFKALGASVEEVDIPWDDSVDIAFAHHIRQVFALSLKPIVEESRELLCDYNIINTEKYLKNINPQDVYDCKIKEAEMYATFGSMMQKFDVFICPTVTTNNISAAHVFGRDPFYVNGKEKLEYGLHLCHQFNMLNRCPVLSVPSGFTSNGLPAGIQIVGNTFDDVSVFKAGAALEKAMNFWEAFRPEL